MILNRRLFIQQVVVSMPAVTMLISIVKGTETSQTTTIPDSVLTDANAPGAGRGMMGRDDNTPTVLATLNYDKAVEPVSLPTKLAP